MLWERLCNSSSLFLKNLFIFGVCWVFTDVLGLSLVAEKRGYSLVVVHGLLTAVVSLVAGHGF